MLILAPYAANPTLIRSMVRRETPWLGVSLEGGVSLSFCSECSKRSMIVVTATILVQSFSYEVSHMMDMMPYEDDSQLITCGDVWADMICSTGGEAFGGPTFILPLDGNLIAA